ncbi:MAG: ABC transporter permease [Anaerolineales bacterium]|nr:ABC transporter permease [Anaerolineales bacterium]
MRTDASRARFLQYVLVFILAVTLNFFLPRLMPGNPLALLAGVDVGLMTPEQREQVLIDRGLDQPLWKQYLKYWEDLLHGDFGYSYRQKQSITKMIGDRLPWTLLITGSSLIISAIIGVVLGAIAAWNRAKLTDVGSLGAMILLGSLPSFWLGMILVSVVSVNYRLLPSFGAVTPGVTYLGWEKLVDIARHAILPIITLSTLSVPGIFITMRYTMLSVLGEDFIRTARSKGLSERVVLFRHVVRNSLAPVVTVLAIRLGFAFGGTVVTETVFSYPGLGRLIFEAVSGRDYPVLQAAFLVITIAVLLSNLLADSIYPLLDPRARGN